MNKKNNTPKRDIASIVDSAVKDPKDAKSKPSPQIAKIQASMAKKPSEKPLPAKAHEQAKSHASSKKKNAKLKGIDMPNEPEAYFVYLKNPLEYRRHLLECSKKILLCLRSHQKLILIRQKKLEGMEKLRGCIKELLYVNKKFNEKLPKYDMAFLEHQPAKMQVTQGVVPSKTPEKKLPVVEFKAPVREKTELEKLEESLASIENKLKNLQ